MKTRVGRWAPMLVVPALVLALAGCSGDDDNSDGASGDQSATDTPSASETSTATTTSPPDLEELPVVNQAEGAVADVDFDQASCETSAGEQTVSGTLTNPTDEPTGYLVSVSWTNATNDVLGRGFTIVRGAKPDRETEWELSADVSEGATQCVLFVQRGVIKK